jgi:hypothetical protein
MKSSLNATYHRTGVYIPTEKMAIGYATVKLPKGLINSFPEDTNFPIPCTVQIPQCQMLTCEHF